MQILINILGIILIITGVFDALKYRWNSAKIRKNKSAKNHSRKFINVALLNDIIRICYAILIKDWYIFVSSLLALICMLELFFVIYWFYPYKSRNLLNFRRPTIFIYFINSCLPNSLRKRL